MAESKMVEFKKAANFSLIENEYGKFFLCKMDESKMAAIIKLNENEWVWIKLN